MKIINFLAFIFFLIIWKSAFADQARILVLVDLCNSCHTAAGELITGIPKIDHLSAKQIELIVKSYKYGGKDSTIMHRIAKGFSDKELKSISKIITKND